MNDPRRRALTFRSEGAVSVNGTLRPETRIPKPETSRSQKAASPFFTLSPSMTRLFSLMVLFRGMPPPSCSPITPNYPSSLNRCRAIPQLTGAKWRARVEVFRPSRAPRRG